MTTDLSEKLAADIKEIDLKLEDIRQECDEAQRTWEECLRSIDKLEDERERMQTARAILNGERVLGKDDTERDKTPDTSEEVQVDTPERENVASMSPEEFEAWNKRQGSKIKKPDGPYADVACSSCGGVGTLYDATQTMKGKPIAVIACSGCSSVRPR